MGVVREVGELAGDIAGAATGADIDIGGIITNSLDVAE